MFISRVPSLPPFIVHMQAERFLGPNIGIHSLGYGSAEAWVGSPYKPQDLEHYKLNNESITEFLDISKDDSIDSIAQSVSTLHEMSSLLTAVVGG